MKVKNILLALTMSIILVACKKKDLLIYDSEIAGVYFEKSIYPPGTVRKDYDRFTDSAYFSFAAGHSTTKDTILRAEVIALGKLKDYPRTFKVSVDQAKSTALEGTHFEIDHNSAVFSAGAAKAYIDVKFKRTDEMLKQKFRLVLKLEDNEYFKVYMEKRPHWASFNPSLAAQQLIDADRFTFIVDDIVTRPPSWIFFQSQYWGPWTAKKYKYINSLLGWTHQDWTLGWLTNKPPSYSPIQTGILPGSAAFVRDKLQALANAGTPMLDENGLGMQISATYRVIY